jgi:hypothetical protein
MPKTMISPSGSSAPVDFCPWAEGFAHFGLYLYPELEQNPSSLFKSATRKDYSQ